MYAENALLYYAHYADEKFINMLAVCENYKMESKANYKYETQTF